MSRKIMKKITFFLVILPLLIALPVIAQTRTFRIADDQYLFGFGFQQQHESRFSYHDFLDSLAHFVIY